MCGLAFAAFCATMLLWASAVEPSWQQQRANTDTEGCDEKLCSLEGVWRCAGFAETEPLVWTGRTAIGSCVVSPSNCSDYSCECTAADATMSDDGRACQLMATAGSVGRHLDPLQVAVVRWRQSAVRR